jgi:hypothetical protein
MNRTIAHNKIPFALFLAGVALWTLAALMGDYKVVNTNIKMHPEVITVADVAIVNFVTLFVAAYVAAIFFRVSFGDFKAALIKLGAIAVFPGSVAHFVPVVGWLVSFALFFLLLVWFFELEVYQGVVFYLVMAVLRMVAWTCLVLVR